MAGTGRLALDQAWGRIERQGARTAANRPAARMGASARCDALYGVKRVSAGQRAS